MIVTDKFPGKLHFIDRIALPAPEILIEPLRCQDTDFLLEPVVHRRAEIGDDVINRGIVHRERVDHRFGRDIAAQIVEILVRVILIGEHMPEQAVHQHVHVRAGESARPLDIDLAQPVRVVADKRRVRADRKSGDIHGIRQTPERRPQKMHGQIELRARIIQDFFAQNPERFMCLVQKSKSPSVKTVPPLPYFFCSSIRTAQISLSPFCEASEREGSSASFPIRPSADRKETA